MNEMLIGTDLPSPQEKGKKIKLYIENIISDDLLFKFMAKCEGGWEIIQDFSHNNFAYWTPEEDGKYIIMVLSKKEDSTKSNDFTSRLDFIIGTVEENLINEINISSNEINLGEKIEINIIPTKRPIMCRYWIKDNSKWNLIKDYSLDTTLSFAPSKVGTLELLVETKDEGSRNQFDDFKNISFTVLPMKPIRINNIKCLSKDIIVNKELTFEVDAKFDESRVILYKFVKIDPHGNMHVIQDFSSRRLVEFKEVIPGDYKLLCMVKDMYSQNKYDDRAIIHYKVVKYNLIKVLSFTSDLSTPQVQNTPIEFKAICSGGDKLLYRFIIDGNYNESSPFSTNNSYRWVPEKSGMYKITVLIKDSSFKEDYEEKASMDFVVEEDYTQNVFIKEIKINKEKYVLKNEKVIVSVEATGSESLLYEFIVRKEGKQAEYIEYSESDTMEFIPDRVGKYEIEVRVKHSKSTRSYDVHSLIYVDCKEYIPAKIEYILTEKKNEYILGEEIEIEVVTENTEETLVRYKVEINNREVETTEFSKNKKFRLIPRCGGLYTLKVYCKNKFSTAEYDCKRDMSFSVLTGAPITNCRIDIDREKIKCNEDINFYVNCDGGKDNLFEFYLMEQGEWKLIQRYSKKNYYTFMPFYKGRYKILALCKSNYSKNAYDDYSVCEVSCEE